MKLLAAALLLILSPALFAEDDIDLERMNELETYGLCYVIASGAGQIMDLRQSGAAPQSIVKHINHSTPQKTLNDLLRNMISTAYQVPLQTSEKSKTESVHLFQALQLRACIETFLV